MNQTAGLLVFLGVGAVLCLGAFALALKTHRFRQRAARAVGTIIESKRGGIGAAVEREREKGRKILDLDPVATSYPGATEISWTITVAFDDATGARRQGTTEVARRFGLSFTQLHWRRLSKRFGRRFYEVGDQVPILYDPESPSVIRIDSFMEQWFGPLVLGALGAGFLVMS